MKPPPPATIRTQLVIPLEFADGYAVARESPGIGLRWDEKAVKRFAA